MGYRRAAVAAAAAIAAAAITAVPAQGAGTPGWRVVLSQHYGVRTNVSGYETVVAPGIGDSWVFGGTDVPLCYSASTGAPVAGHWNGTRWAPVSLPAGLVGDIAASAAVNRTSVWAANESGSGNASVLHWNGTRWSVAAQLPGTEGYLVSGMLAFSDTNVWVFGGSSCSGGTGTWHYDGRTWTKVTSVAGSIYEATALSASDTWAITSVKLPQDTILHGNGTTWQPVTAPGPAWQMFAAILVLPHDNVWVAASTGTAAPHMLNLAGGKWTSVPIPWKFTGTASLVSDGAGGFWLIGYNNSFTVQTWAVHRTSAGVWSRTQLAGAALISNLALVPGTTSVWDAATAPGSNYGGNAKILAYGPER